jgi:hypothetical protein
VTAARELGYEHADITLVVTTKDKKPNLSDGTAKAT